MENLYKLYKEHAIISTDSRNIVAGCLFFALKGENFNGNNFANQALAAGAAYAIVDDDTLPEHAQFIKVPNVLDSLQKLAHHHRRQLNIPVVAITGTNGKTTTKELTAQVLSVKYKVGVTRGNLNNHIGLPLTLLSMDKTTQIGVVEMGANHIGEIAALCSIAEPNYGLITNVGKAHLEGFGSFEGVKKAKGELYNFLSTHKGVIFFNADNPLLTEMVNERQAKGLIPYGLTTDKAAILQANADNPFLHLAVESYPEIKTQLIGAYNADNVLAALAIARQFGINAEEAATAISNYQPSNNRSQLLQKGGYTFIMDAYNANPTSMAAAIENFSNLQAVHKWAILGDMLELGAATVVEHRSIIQQLKEKRLQNVFLVGPHFMEANIGNNFQAFLSVDDLIAHLQQYPLPQSASILLKGSRGIQIERMISDE
ncbi:MAG: UDP-N-acetylmuramoyl-tripeptide--D-alanyl-D-alanine ligase [Bacteroidales bacterium]|nr:UDP-N-acetylmuramoyl-tripeptide--D-alanyl-D-alanine ligase [Bacteroidales bacterium]MCL2133406.1 UDP-N-acetylmuramoyl-tripeptide--D-alanyl-D-alanine ligase [Bacteroidales bacterium]